MKRPRRYAKLPRPLTAGAARRDTLAALDRFVLVVFVPKAG